MSVKYNTSRNKVIKTLNTKIPTDPTKRDVSRRDSLLPTKA